MPAVYRPRDPRKTPLFRLLEPHYESVKLHWEQRFEARYGFFCGFWDQEVARYLDCGIWDNGFARICCDACRHEMLVAFSCKQRGLCPSCSAKRGAELGAFLIDHVKQDVGHAQWVFTIPKMLRPLFFKMRHLAWAPRAPRLGDRARPDGGGGRGAGSPPRHGCRDPDFRGSGQPSSPRPRPRHSGRLDARRPLPPVPFVDPAVAQRLFQRKVLGLLEREGLIAPERVALLLSWRHTGFSVHNSVRIAADDTDGLEALVRYLMRPPVSLARLQWLPGGQDVLHFPKGKGDDPGSSSPERIDAIEYVARVLSQIPEPRKHQVRYYGYYSCAARGKRLKDPLRSQEGSTSVHPNEPDPPPQTAALRKRWADLLRRIYEVDPLVCPRCSSQMRVVSFNNQPAVLRRILDHMRRTPRPATRPPRHDRDPFSPRPDGTQRSASWRPAGSSRPRRSKLAQLTRSAGRGAWISARHVTRWLRQASRAAQEAIGRTHPKSIFLSLIPYPLSL